MELEKALLLVALSLTAWSALALLLDRRGHAGINRGFALLLASLCVPQAYFYSRLLAPPDGATLLGLAAQATLWLKGPLLWLMVRLAVAAPRQPAGRHFLPFALVLGGLVLWPQARTPLEALGALHALAYLLASLRALRAARTRLALIYRGHPNSAYYWLLWVVGGLSLLIVADLALVGLARVAGMLSADAFARVAWPVSGYLLAVACFSLYRPQLFFHQQRSEPDDAATDAAPAGRAEPAASPPQGGDRPWRELDDSVASQLAERLARLMADEQLYRDGDLSLPRLAGRLGASAHQTSELLNVHLGVGFYDYLARLRLDHACRLLRDPACEWRVIDIAFEAGFGNKNSFYRQFRDAFGMTPAEYRQRHPGGAEQALA